MKTVSGLFDDRDDAISAVNELKAYGVDGDDISIVSHHADGTHVDESGAAEGAGTGAGLGAAIGGIGGLLTGLGMMAIPGVGPVVAAGWLVATAAGAATGAVVGGAAGGLIGALTDSGVSEEDANLYAEGVRRGGTLVTARVDNDQAAEAQDILQRSNWVDLPTRRNSYQEQGWSRFDNTLDPYSPTEVAAERDRYRSDRL